MKDMKKNCEITEEEKLNYEVKKIEFIIEEIKDTERRFSESIHEVIQVCQFFSDELKTAKNFHNVCGIWETSDFGVNLGRFLN